MKLLHNFFGNEMGEMEHRKGRGDALCSAKKEQEPET